MFIKDSKTLSFFEEISKIPRESGNEKEIATYLCEFAENRGLYYEVDEYYNVYIRKETGTNEFLILQAHTDMVCEKEQEKQFSFSKDSIELVEESGFLRANGTTLGADNGIGVAQILSILDSLLPCNIEAVFTASEETTMDGASCFDTSKLKGRMLLNLDGFSENSILIQSASFHDIVLHDSYFFQEIEEKRGYSIQLSGLLGGHSGEDIDKNRGNASILMASFLKQISNIQISSFVGGTKFNVIPSFATASFITTLNEKEINEKLENFIMKNKKNFPNLQISLGKTSVNKILSKEDSKKWLEFISLFPDGVYLKDKNIPTTSMNLGVVDLEKHIYKLGMRSIKKEEEKCLSYLMKYCENNQISLEIIGYQPGFSSDSKSKLITSLLNAHPIELFLKAPSIKSVHFTVEAGFFQEKIPDIEIAIISCNIIGAHTTKECVEIESIKRTDEWLFRFIKSL